MTTALAAAERAALAVLLRAWRGLHTVPAPGLYPHQWSWDSAFVAVGLRHASPRRAAQELEQLLSAQWADGRVPQIVYDPARDADYSPGASFWRSGELPGTPPVPTAGLVQPPVHAWAALLVHEADPEGSTRRRFLPRAYPRLVAWHEYLRTRRDRSGLGLASAVHPWETGTDNSPAWDRALERAGAPARTALLPRPDLQHAAAGERPTSRDYERYLWLAARYRDTGCDDAAPDLPFAVEDPGLNALWARSELALAEVARAVGADPAPHEARAAELTRALEALWSPALGTYAARDALRGQVDDHATVGGLLPLLVPGAEHADELLAALRGPGFALGRARLVPSYDLTAPDVDTARYWRGPSWGNTAWMVAEALAERGLLAEAQALRAGLVELAAQGCPEYVDPLTGEPHGTRSFAWTAALALDAARWRGGGSEEAVSDAAAMMVRAAGLDQAGSM